jgi:hypothetical protein
LYSYSINNTLQDEVTGSAGPVQLVKSSKLLIWLTTNIQTLWSAVEKLLCLAAAAVGSQLMWPLRRSNSNSSSDQRRPSLTPAEKLKGYYDLAKVRASPAQLQISTIH